MIDVKNLTKQFKLSTAVERLTFRTNENEVIGFLGVNGAGKTTTMRLLLGYLFPSSGSVSVNGKNPGDDRMDILPQVGYLPENNPLYPEMKVSEYLQMIAEIKREKDLDAIIHSVNLREVVHKKIEELSRGYKQRVGLAGALCGNPKLLILDEPTSGLDPIEQEKIRSLIKKTAKTATIIFSTHILSEIEEMAHRIIIIHKGKIVFDGRKPTGKGAVSKLFKKLVS